MSDSPSEIHPEAAVAPGYLANHLARAFNRTVDAALKPHGMSMALIGPIMLLSWKGPMRQRDLVQASAVRQPAMVALLDKLEALGAIARAPNPDDRRASTVMLTERGAALAMIGRRALMEANATALAGFTSSEQASVVAMMQRLVENVEAAAGHKHHV